MKALVLERQSEGTPKLRVRDVPKPELGPHDALVRVLACGLCHHDKLAIEGTLRRGIRSPVILGHEICGDVEEVGSEVSLVKPGQRVVPLLTEACGSCERCLAGREHRCLNGRGIGHGIDGGFAPYVRVRETALVPVPREIPPEQACLLTCPIGVGLQGAEDVGEVAAGEWVMVTGASGGLGVHALQIAKALGAKTVAVTSSEGKMTSLIELGVDDVVPVGGELDFVEIVRALTAEEGVNVVLDTVGSPLFSSSVRALAQYGRLVLLGEVADGRTDVSLPELLFRDAKIMGSTGAQRRHTERAAQLVSEGAITPIVHATLPLKDVLVGVGWMAEKRLFGRVVVLPE
ncbi:MAG: alcohol dehydrogenase catalytic domain-containing protein [Chloroflexi bacterium]|nr:alcohol dehydrogenase catalytic domain-containing protein [Chloroflexota bacterium]